MCKRYRNLGKKKLIYFGDRYKLRYEADDKITIEDRFVDSKFGNENVVISSDTKIYIDDLLKKTVCIKEMKFLLKHLNLDLKLKKKITEKKQPNTLDDILTVVSTTSNGDTLTKEKSKIEEIMDTSVSLKQKFKTENDNSKTIDLKKLNLTQMTKKSITQ